LTLAKLSPRAPAPEAADAGVDIGADSNVYPGDMTLTVSKLAARVGLTADTIRYYERAGLLPPPDRTESGYRAYEDGAVERLHFIKGAQCIGLRLQEIA
jgi:hypothetical protein